MRCAGILPACSQQEARTYEDGDHELAAAQVSIRLCRQMRGLSDSSLSPDDNPANLTDGE
jgi:hypothetical protein